MIFEVVTLSVSLPNQGTSDSSQGTLNVVFVAMIIGASWLFGEIFLLFPRFPDLPSATYVTKLDFLFDTDIDSEITKKKFDPQTLMAATLAVCGVGFLELAGSQQFVIGRACALWLSLQSLATGKNHLLNIVSGEESKAVGLEPRIFLISWRAKEISFPLLSPLALAWVQDPEVERVQSCQKGTLCGPVDASASL